MGQISFYTNKRYQSFFLQQKEIDSRHLFYSHKSGTLEAVYFIDEKNKVALSSDRSYLVLLDQSNIHQDTIRFTAPVPMEMPPVIIGNDLYFIGLGETTQVRIDGSSYEVKSLPKFKRADLATPFGDGLIAPDSKGMRKQDAFPAFQFFRDKKPVPLSQPLPFMENGDFSKVVPSVYNITFSYYDSPEELIVFPTYTQQLVRLNKTTKQASYTKLPYETGEQIGYFFRDHTQSRSYVLKHFFNSNFMELYLVDMKDNKLSFVKAVPYFPEAIVNGSFYCRELDDEGRVNHFLIPISSL